MRPIPQIKIYYAYINARTPARCNRRTGEIYLNLNRWHEIEPAHRVFIILHEIGHIVLNSSDELAVDAWAQKQYIAHGYPLTESVRAITTVLKGCSIEQIERGKQALDYAKKINEMNRINNIRKPMTIGENLQQIHDSEDFLGLGKRARQRREEKREVKLDKKRAKNNIKNSRAESLIIKAQGGADASKILAEQGIVSPKAGEGLTQGLGNLVGGIGKAFLGGGGTTEVESAGTANYIPPPAEKPFYKNASIMVPLVIAVVVVVAGAIYYFKSRKKGK